MRRTERRRQEVDPTRQIRHGREQPTHRGDRAVTEHGFGDERFAPAAAAVADHRVVRCGPRRAGHPERFEEMVGHVALEGGAGDVAHDAPEDAVAEVGVLERHPRHPGERHAVRHDCVELVVAEVEVAVGPGVIGGEARAHRQQVAHGHGRCAGERRAERGELGRMPFDGIVEPEPAGVAQHQHGRCREALRHRRDAVHRVDLDARQHRAVAHETPRQTRQVQTRPVVLEAGRTQARGRVEIEAGVWVHAGRLGSLRHCRGRTGGLPTSPARPTRRGPPAHPSRRCSRSRRRTGRARR